MKVSTPRLPLYATRHAALLAALLAACAAPAWAQFTQDNVSSDSLGDTAMGTGALDVVQRYESTNSGVYDTAAGFNAAFNNTTGNDNTAFGYQTLYSNGSGGGNTGVGSHALYHSIASGNTALGGYALYTSTSGLDNTALGYAALYTSHNGEDNTAVGFQALYTNGGAGTDGNYNTALGALALFGNESGNNNVAAGYDALGTNTIGTGNAAVGYEAMHVNKSGADNSAVGTKALFALTSGGHNVALGFEAGLNLKTGSNDIDIGSPGGTSSESGAIRIGTLGTHTTAYLQGVYGVGTSATPVFVDSSGQLTAPLSSERFKTDVVTMGEATQKLGELRPVTFHYKTDANGTTQYGLVAEEVAQVYPELVIRGPEGRVDGVRYDQLAPMLLNEVQKERQRRGVLEIHLAAQEVTIRAQAQALQGQMAQLEELKRAVADLASRVGLPPGTGGVATAEPR